MGVFREDLVFLDATYPSQEAFYAEMGAILYEKGLVKDTFADALMARERDFPTGLQTEVYGVAIPHTDVKHVNEVFIAFVRLNEPLVYSHMGDPDLKVGVRFAFVLGIMDPQAQLDTLGALIGGIVDSETMGKLDRSDDPAEIVEILNGLMK